MNYLDIKKLRQRPLSELRLYGGGCSLLRTSLRRNTLFKRENTGKTLTKFPSTLLHTQAFPRGSSASRQPVANNSYLKQGIIRELTDISQIISFQMVQFLGRTSYPCRSKKTIESIRTNTQEGQDSTLQRIIQHADYLLIY